MANKDGKDHHLRIEDFNEVMIVQDDEEHKGDDDDEEEDEEDDLAQYFEGGNPMISMEDFFMQWAKIENKSN